MCPLNPSMSYEFIDILLSTYKRMYTLHTVHLIVISTSTRPITMLYNQWHLEATPKE